MTKVDETASKSINYTNHVLTYQGCNRDREQEECCKHGSGIVGHRSVLVVRSPLDRLDSLQALLDQLTIVSAIMNRKPTALSATRQRYNREQISALIRVQDDLKSSLPNRFNFR